MLSSNTPLRSVPLTPTAIDSTYSPRYPSSQNNSKYYHLGGSERYNCTPHKEEGSVRSRASLDTDPWEMNTSQKNYELKRVALRPSTVAASSSSTSAAVRVKRPTLCTAPPISSPLSIPSPLEPPSPSIQSRIESDEVKALKNDIQNLEIVLYDDVLKLTQLLESRGQHDTVLEHEKKDLEYRLQEAKNKMSKYKSEAEDAMQRRAVVEAELRQEEEALRNLCRTYDEQLSASDRDLMAEVDLKTTALATMSSLSAWTLPAERVNELQDIYAKIRNATRNHDRYVMEMMQMEDDIERLNADFASHMKQYDSVERQLKSEITDLMTYHDEYGQEVRARRAKVLNNEELSRSIGALAMLREQINILNREMHKMQLECEAGNVMQSSSLLQDEYEAEESERVTLSDRLESLISEHDSLARRLTSLRTIGNDDDDTSAAVIIRETDEMKAKLKHLTSDYNMLCEESSRIAKDLKSSITATEHEISDLLSKIKLAGSLTAITPTTGPSIGVSKHQDLLRDIDLVKRRLAGH